MEQGAHSLGGGSAGSYRRPPEQDRGQRRERLEISIKRMSGKLAFQHNTLQAIVNGQFEALVITPEHADAAGSLPLYHHDPFDRLLVAQAKLESLVLVTHDRQLLPYGVPLLGVS